MGEPESSITEKREYVFCVDNAARSLRTAENPKGMIAEARADLYEQLLRLGLKPRELGELMFVADVNPYRKESDWKLIENVQKRIAQKILPINVYMHTPPVTEKSATLPVERNGVKMNGVAHSSMEKLSGAHAIPIPW